MPAGAAKCRCTGRNGSSPWILVNNVPLFSPLSSRPTVIPSSITLFLYSPLSLGIHPAVFSALRRFTSDAWINWFSLVNLLVIYLNGAMRQYFRELRCAGDYPRCWVHRYHNLYISTWKSVIRRYIKCLLHSYSVESCGKSDFHLLTVYGNL